VFSKREFALFLICSGCSSLQPHRIPSGDRVYDKSEIGAPLECEIPVSLPEYSAIETDNFSVVGVQNGKHGGNLMTILAKKSWSDDRKDFSEHGEGDLVLDLRFYPTVLGKEGSEFFGYKILSDKTSQMPDVDEVNGAIERFNSGLNEKDPLRIGIQLYRSPVTFGTPETYVRRFGREGKIPISMKKRQHYHDMSGHALEGFFFDSRIVQTARNRANLWLDFVEEISKNLSKDSLARLGTINQNVLRRITDTVDYIGNLEGAFIDDASQLHLRNLGYLVMVKRGGKELKMNVPVVLSEVDLRPEDITLLSNDFSNLEVGNMRAHYDTPFFSFFDDKNLDLAQAFAKYLKLVQERNPELLKPVPYDLKKSLVEIRGLKLYEVNGEAWLEALLKIEISKDFAGRIRRLRTLVAKEAKH
jgi:hypothetical protein